MFRWWRQMREAAEVASVLADENEELRAENASLWRQLAGQKESLEVLNDCVKRLNHIHAQHQEAAS